MRFDECTIGRRAERTHTVTDADIQAFAAVSGDDNPLHLDEAAASATRYKGRIAHGMLSAGYISAVIGTQLPGFGAVYVSQSLLFKRPVRPGDTITTECEIVERMDAERRVRMSTVCRNQLGKPVIEGEAVIWLPPETG
jgi:3-hydroxybutyryl-CoA dehydratase